MSYLLDKKTKRNRYFRVALGVLVLILLFYFRLGIFSGLSYISETFFHPVLVLGRNTGGKFGSIGAYFSSKSSLYAKNQDLEGKLREEEARMSNYSSLLSENESLKEMLGRRTEKDPMVLAAILSGQNQSIYDTLTLDAGTKEGVKEGNIVFAKGSVPIGRVVMVYANSSKAILFSNPGERTSVIVSEKNTPLELVGRGGGNFELVMPKDFTLLPGAQVVLPGINPYLVAVTEKIISDPRDPFTKALLIAPVNVREIKFVEINISANNGIQN